MSWHIIESMVYPATMGEIAKDVANRYCRSSDELAIIKKAKKAMKKGDFDKAVKLANQAKKQSSDALAQYADQKDAANMHLK